MRNILFYLCTLCTLNGISQELGMQYYSTGSGRNLTATFSKSFNNNQFGIGIGYNINRIQQPDDQGFIYHKRLFATKPLQHINFNLFYQRKILKQLKSISPFIFYDFQLKHSTTRSSMFLPFSYDSTEVFDKPEDGILYKNIIRNYGAFTWVENNIGIGYEINLFENLLLNQKFGFGTTIILGNEPRLGKFGTLVELNFFLSLGISYKLK